MNKVYVVGQELAYERMFMNNGWKVVNDPDDADALQFTGGEDVSPMLYEEPLHAATGCNPKRDQQEAHLFHLYEGEKAMLGICRGSQFLTVMNGGRLWQHVDNHAIGGEHQVKDLETQKTYMCSSTHHQMMDPSEATSAIILGVAGRTTYKEDGWGHIITQQEGWEDRDIEVVYYPETNSLAFQPHPEYYSADHQCQQYYFELINRYVEIN